MEITSRRKILKDNLKGGIMRYLAMNLALLLVLILVRIFEYFYLNQIITTPEGCWKLELYGVGHDCVIILNFSAFLLIPFLFTHIIYKPLAVFLYGIAITIFIIADVAFILYFGNTSLLLGSDIFGYSVKEIIYIASAGSRLSIINLLCMIAGIAIIALILKSTKFLKINPIAALIFVLISFISLFLTQFASPKEGKYKTELAHNIVTNKAYYFLSQAYKTFCPDRKNEATLSNYFYVNTLLSTSSFEYVSTDYPFLRKDKTPDILGKYLKVSDKKPNLVFIIVESLGRAYSGEGAYMKSFTPFLDSLEEESLYWENMLSTASRTFEVLPSIFGSLPYGENGFAELGDGMPECFTLISLLKKNGYKSRFIYGGDANFDNMALFLKKQGIDSIIDEKDFGPGYAKIPSDSHNFTWGYGDMEIFKKGLVAYAGEDAGPSIDIYLTLAMHDPFIIPNQSYYIKRAEERLTELQLTKEQKKEYRKFIKNLSTILYFDDALRLFFEFYKKRADFDNTIFFITGDHRMSSPPINTQIDRYHVPFIVYSKMIKEPTRFSSIVSHLDITPSVVALLKNNYGLKFPSVVPWLGRGLDSIKTFNSTISVPFIRTKYETTDYLDNEYFCVRNELFIISDNMSLSPVNDVNNKISQIQDKFQKFKRNNITACYNNRLIPDSLYINKK